MSVVVIWGVVVVSQLALIIIGVGVGSQSGAFRWSRLIHFGLGFGFVRFSNMPCQTFVYKAVCVIGSDHIQYTHTHTDCCAAYVRVNCISQSLERQNSQIRELAQLRAGTGRLRVTTI